MGWENRRCVGTRYTEIRDIGCRRKDLRAGGEVSALGESRERRIPQEGLGIAFIERSAGVLGLRRNPLALASPGGTRRLLEPLLNRSR